ncbi:hypothetical protein D9613_004199 [Agrocybe pediades]|uniref:Uncharacterized protein n=1 Tax=Agrocybe pediades TaxID=84607 RepID=A0A8H4QKD2_9AGAR|nr:hypothetical protein D9613_004199 [Agrocybe pediades]KAF9567832.1 NAD(P)-binding protein [Agrocybe pediades]
MSTNHDNVSLEGVHSQAIPFPKPVASKTSVQIGFIGLGNIGSLMAQNMARKGPIGEPNFPAIMVWNRTPSKAEKLVAMVGKEKARIAQDLEQVAQECDVVVINLANDDVVRTVYLRIQACLKQSPPTRNKIFVETSTIYPSLAAELDVMVSQCPLTRLITCPVIGSPIVAEKSELILVMSGEYRSKQEVSHLLVPAVGRKVIDLGGDVQKSLTFKLIGNSMILGNIEVIAEALTFAEKSGIGGHHVEHLIREYLPAPSMLSYTQKMRHANFDGKNGFSIDGGIKDATHIRRLTAHYNSPMPGIDVAHQNLLTARALHERHVKEGKTRWPTLDWSGIIAGTRVAAGLNGFDKTKDFGTLDEQ